MGTVVVLALLGVLAIAGLVGWGVADSRDGKDWQPLPWPHEPSAEERRRRNQRRHR